MRTNALIVFALFITACGANDSILKSGKETPSSNSTTAVSEIDSDLAAVKNADFRWIYILRRKDGGVIDAEDKKVIKANTVEANRRVSTDGEKAFIIGTNTQIPADKLAALYQHFAVEDQSPPPPDANTNANTNANVAAGK
jgi:hypothetical protein